MNRFYLRNWSLRAKLVALIVAASVLPLTLSAVLEVREVRRQVQAATDGVLAARADQIAREFDGMHQGYQRSVQRLAHLPVTGDFCGGDASQGPRLMGVLRTFPASDAEIRGAGVLATDGRVLLATERELVGQDMSASPTLRAALRGQASISGVHLSSAATGEQPTVSYLVPVKDATGVRCVIAVWVRAEVFWRALKTAAEQAAPGSFGVAYDRNGIRIAHTLRPDFLFRPAGPLDAAQAEELVATRAFGARTSERLRMVLPSPRVFEKAREKDPDGAAMRVLSPANEQWNVSVARRLRTTHWTVVYVQPESVIHAALAKATREHALLALLILLAAAGVGAYVAAQVLRPVQALAGATAALASGNPAVRVAVRPGVAPGGGDELSRLGASFNAMADQIAAQSDALRRANSDLEQRVDERSKLLNGVIDNSSAPIYAVDLQGRFLVVNEALARLFGSTKANAIGKASDELLDRAQARAFQEVNARVAARGTTVVSEETVEGADGPRTYLSVRSPLRDEEGLSYGVVSVSTDITERKHAESRRQVQLQQLRLLDEITTAMSARLDVRRVGEVATSSLEERMPVDFSCICTHDAASGQLTVAQLGAHSRGLKLEPPWAEGSSFLADGNGMELCLREGGLVYEPDIASSQFAFPRRLAAAGLRSLVIAPLLGDGKATGALVAARRAPEAFDSTDCEFLRQLSAHVAVAMQQAHLHEALRHAYEELRQSQQMVLQRERLSALGQMASGIAHDVNNAISPAAIYTEALLEREQGLSERGRAQLQVIGRALDDVAATVARMREFYRPREAGAGMAPADLNELVRQVLQLTHARWSDMPQQRGIEIRVATNLGGDLPAVNAVESELREALINLIFNAVDAMPAGGVLTVRTRAAAGGGQVELEVADSGVGMDAETCRRCLEPFFTTKGERGTGLGLAMVYGAVQRHQGAIEIDTRPGAGTTFRVRLPIASGPGQRLGPLAAPVAVRHLRILLVDDEPMLTRSVGDTLRADGHEVVAVNSGEAAIEAFMQSFAGRGFDTVVTDLGMPQVSGRQVATAIKSVSPRTPVILLTGWGQRLGEEEEALPGDFDAVLAKPPKLPELRAMLARLAGPAEATPGPASPAAA